MRKLKNLLCLVFLLTATLSYAQPYKSAIGGRVGFPSWINFSFKHNFGPHWAIELAAGTDFNYAGVDVAGEYHFDITSVEGMRWYLGAAFDVGGYFRYGGYGYYKNNYYGYGYGHSALSMGASIFGGLEYTFSNIPLNLAFDLGPRLPIFPYIGYGYGWARVGVCARYTFK